MRNYSFVVVNHSDFHLKQYTLTLTYAKHLSVSDTKLENDLICLEGKNSEIYTIPNYHSEAILTKEIIINGCAATKNNCSTKLVIYDINKKM